ncbi:hypothetical protein EC968_001675 [Mortierella alpina]|nr:hypothetical protein EC968_001675 [Mortierella alpina]
MSSAEQYVRTEFPVIDSDPHFNRVVRYMRGSDYAAWGGLTVGAPAVLLALERVRPAAGPKGINVALGVAAAVGFMGGFLYSYQKSSLRFWGWEENAREQALNRTEMDARAAAGLPAYGEPTMDEANQAASARNSKYAATKFSAIPWFNTTNHKYHLAENTNSAAQNDNLTANGQPLVRDAPSAKALGGAHILLENDVDSRTPKDAVILLSKPRDFNESQAACEILGEKLVESDTEYLARLLSVTPVAQAEIKRFNRFWVQGNSSSPHACLALDRGTRHVTQLSCSTQLPALCSNSLPRTLFYTKHNSTQNDKSKQIKVSTPRMGTWQGYRDQNQFRFLGIPFAEAPVGRRRFAAPTPVDTTKYVEGGSGNATESRVNSAIEYGNACIQKLEGGVDPNFAAVDVGPISEDCLYLNVFTPSLKNKGYKGLPVMVWLYGGSYTSGAASAPMYEPGNLVSRGGVVVVTLNYRLGIFGQFEFEPAIPRSKAPGNLATRDQMVALQWVQDNIVSFGGDPERVTVFGESAGGPKFSSGNLGNFTMQILGCHPSDLVCAQNKTVDVIQDAESQAIDRALALSENDWVDNSGVYRPTADGSLIPADFAQLVISGRFNKNANILWGTTRDEFAFFIPYIFPDPIPLNEADATLNAVFKDNRTQSLLRAPFYKFDNAESDTVRAQVSRAITDYNFGCGVQVMSGGVSAQKSTVYAYRMDHGRNLEAAFGGVEAEFSHGRVSHTADLAPTFGSGDVLPGVEQTGDDARFARQIIDRWSTFAWTGNPNPKSGQPGLACQNQDVMDVQWPAYTSANSVFALRVQNSTVDGDADKARCDWIAENIHYDYQVHGPGGEFVPIFPDPRKS